MATVNKSSLRTEFDALKARFESLCAEGTMSADSRALFDALLMLFEVLMAVFMEKHTPKSSANSSLRNGPRELDSVVSEIFLGFQAANSR